MTGLVLALALTTLVPNCGTTSNLQYKPRDVWSPNCASDSRHVQTIRWDKWTRGSAKGAGYTSGDTGPHHAWVMLSRPRTCRAANGGAYRYFSRVKLELAVGPDLLHEPHSIRYTRTVPPTKGLCTRS